MPAGLAIGWDSHNGAADAALAFVLLLWLRYSLLWISIFMGLTIRNSEALMTGNRL